jgi:hypothetical protein
LTALELRARILEGRDLWSAGQDEAPPASVGGVVVSGMLAEQLARQLGAGADAGAVSVGDGRRTSGAEVLVHVIAGDPSQDDTALVRAADLAGVPVVLVQLWPQARWTAPFVLSPFVVECRAGEGFPVREIADRITEAAEHAPALAARIPLLQESVGDDVVRGAVVRAAILGFLGSRRGSTRPALALEQVRTVSQLRTLDSPATAASDPRAVAGAAALVFASSFAFRAAARATRGKLPAPLANAAFAAAGTWALAKAARKLEASVLQQ